VARPLFTRNLESGDPGSQGDGRGSTFPAICSRVFDAYEFYSDEPRRLDDTAVCAKVRDAVNAAVTDVLLNRLVDQLNIATGGELRDDMVTIVEEGPSGRARSSCFFR
jgi:hypothetical protein